MPLPALTAQPLPAPRLTEAASARACAERVCSRLLQQSASAVPAQGGIDLLTVMALLHG